MPRLRKALGPKTPKLLVKRDDSIAFAFGGNKVRKLEFVLAEALAGKADTLVTCGGVHSNHVRVTASAAARHGLDCVLVINGSKPRKPSGNALLDELSGARMVYVSDRGDRVPKMDAVVAELEKSGKRPYLVPLGASTSLGALGYARAVDELVSQGHRPDTIIVSSSSGGTLAGMVAGVRLCGLRTSVIAISPDDPAGDIAGKARAIVEGMGPLLEIEGAAFVRECEFNVDDTFVGEGYGIPTEASREAITLAARNEALYLDPTYTAKAMAGLISYVRAGRFAPEATVLFWHTGGLMTLI